VRIKELEITQVGPIKRVSVTDLSDVVVFAGPNGVGKEKLSGAVHLRSLNGLPLSVERKHPSLGFDVAVAPVERLNFCLSK
jgi:recombinational DNA repair ATPase RecF